MEQLQEGLRRGVDSVAAEVERNTLAAAGRFAGWVVLVGVAGAAALGLLAFRNRWLEVLRATVAGLVAVVLSVGFTAIGYNTAAFQAPTYTGSLRLVPQLFGPVEGAIERVGYFRDELRRVVAGAARAYAAVESNPLGRGDEVRVLHISDIHLSTLGYGFAQELARSFDVDLVIDTGDTTSFGAPERGVHPLGYPGLRAALRLGARQPRLGRLPGRARRDSRTPSCSTARPPRSMASGSTGSDTPTSTRNEARRPATRRSSSWSRRRRNGSRRT